MTKKSTTNQAGTEKRTYSVAEIADILQIGINQAYKLCRESLFNTVRIGNSVWISKVSFDRWLDDNQNKGD